MVRLVPNDQAAEKDAPLIWTLLPEEMRRHMFLGEIANLMAMLMSEQPYVFVVDDPITAFCWMRQVDRMTMEGVLFPERMGDRLFAELLLKAWDTAVRRGLVSELGAMRGSTDKLITANFVRNRLAGDPIVTKDGFHEVRITAPRAKLEAYLVTP